MKEANLLVFRDYSVKIGDFGISIKLDEEASIEDEIYELKGVTMGYCKQNFADALSNGTGECFSKAQLFENDYFGFIKSF